MTLPMIWVAVTAIATAMTATDPPRDCGRCARLVDFRRGNRRHHPDFFNAPVPSWGDPAPWLLIVGLAPGLKGANRTGRPFTGDYAGDLLYPSLIERGWATGRFDRRPDDGMTLNGVRITNAVRCVPPANKPTGAEINACRDFLKATIEALPTVSVFLALGRIAHQSLVTALEGRQKDMPFGHAARHSIGGRALIDSYHCSRYNVNTGRLTPAMFNDALDQCA